MRVLNRHKEVNSQGAFLGFILKELKKLDEDYVVSSYRVKRLASRLDGVGIFVEKRRSNREARRCFVCGGELDPIKTRDLRGSDTLVGKRCRDCGFELDRKNLGPKKYIFYMR